MYFNIALDAVIAFLILIFALKFPTAYRMILPLPLTGLFGLAMFNFLINSARYESWSITTSSSISAEKHHAYVLLCFLFYMVAVAIFTKLFLPAKASFGE
jgi:hypothetical protein